MKGKLLIALVPLMLSAGSLKNDLIFVIDGDSKPDATKVRSISSSIRKRPGKYGQGYLIERRTINYAKPDQMVLGDNTKISGKTNKLTIGADGFCAIPQSGLRKNSLNYMSFKYQGQGNISITMEMGEEVKTLAQLKATAQWQNAGFVVKAPGSVMTIKIRATGAVVLDNLMFDRNIGFPNTYHKPGPMRNVDVINLNPQIFNAHSGSMVCWIKAPWLKPNGNANACGLYVAAKNKTKELRGNALIKSFVIWGYDRNNTYSSTLYDSLYSFPKGAISLGLNINEIKATPDGWHLIVSNWKKIGDQMEISIIIDGRQVFTKRGKCNPSTKADYFDVGYNCGSYTNGILDDIALFKRPLTPAEANQIFTAQQPLKQLLK